jgi:hypothetical protein
MVCTNGDTRVPPHARMHAYDIARFKREGVLVCDCGKEWRPSPAYLAKQDELRRAMREEDEAILYAGGLERAPLLVAKVERLTRELHELAGAEGAI